MLTKLRIGVCPLRIETGRYEIVNRVKGVPAHERFCLCCHTARVEDEFHFVMVCPIYEHLRTRLLNVVSAHITANAHTFDRDVLSVIHEDRAVMFRFIMQSASEDVIHALAKFVWSAFKYRERVLA